MYHSHVSSTSSAYLLSAIRSCHGLAPALAPYGGCFVIHSSAEWRHAKRRLSQGNLASILDASIHHTEEGILRSRGVTHWLVMGRWLHSPTCTTNDYAKAVLTTFVVLRCAFCKLRRNFVCCLVNHLSGGGVNATEKETKRIEISNHKSQTMTFWARSSKRMFRKRSEVR